MNDIMLNMYIRKCEIDYIRFMEIDRMPSYTVIPKEVSINLANQQGFESPAAAFYDVPTGSHKLTIWRAIPQLRADYIIFHEFTHILDAEKYSNKNKINHMSNKGYTEYHAAQIDFMKLLGASKARPDAFSFSMHQSFDTIGGEKTAQEFLEAPHRLASEMINRDDFPANIEALATTLGLIFNYYGRRSICKMYATDYLDNIDNTLIAKLIREDTVNALNVFMLGWFEPNQVHLIDQLYQRMVISLAQQNHL